MADPGPDWRALYFEALATLRDLTKAHQDAAAATSAATIKLLRRLEEQGTPCPSKPPLYSGPHGDYTVDPPPEQPCCDYPGYYNSHGLHRCQFGRNPGIF